MKFNISLILIIINFTLLNSQYTETINSNRPGSSHGAFSVGTNVLQFETGIKNNNIGFGKNEINEQEFNFIFRYGVLFENLELLLKGSVINNNYSELKNNNSNQYLKKTSLGIKYLIYNPFKNKDWYKTNLYSWKANNKIKATDFIPALSINIGLNINEKDYLYSLNSHLGLIGLIVDKQTNENFSISKSNEIFRKIILLNDRQISYEINLITQNHFLKNWVLVNNVSFEDLNYRIPSMNYTVTLTNNFNNPRWSAFIEYSKRKNNLFSSDFMKTGIAHLIDRNFQIDFNSGFNMINPKKYLFLEIGFSSRFDWHQDKLPIDRKKIKAERDVRKSENKNLKREYKLIKKQDKINNKFDRKESRLIKKNNRKNKR